MRFINIFQFALITFLALPAFAAEGAVSPMSHFAAAIAISVAAFGGAIAQGRAAATALEGIARNPGARGDIFTPMILALALIESLVIYALLIAFSILG
jgi:F-type H+-transporting ATPase subunit c